MRHRNRDAVRVIPERVRAPSQNGVLAYPAPSEWPQLLAASRAERSASIGGLSLSEFRNRARSQTAALAGVENFGDRPVILSGHQPELVHPGVWIKNFAARGFADSAQGVAVHIATDNDNLKSTSIPVLGGSPAEPLVAMIPFDAWTGETPTEARGVVNVATFRAFGAACAAHMSELGFEPIIRERWKVAAEAGELSLGERFGALRRAVEREFGGGCVETTLSGLCAISGSAFLRLAAEVLVRLPDYARIYNEELVAFRTRHRIRSRHHPAPELTAEDGWIEAPFWGWTNESPIRRRPFAKLAAGRLLLKVGDEVWCDAPARLDAVAEALGLLDDRKLRPRALLTTAFLRLGIADLFIHGIGGARYDEWNDAVIRRFWNLEPPPFAVCTATLRLPTADLHPDAVDDRRAADRELRRAYWNPESVLDDELLERAPLAEWIEEKAELVAEEPVEKKARRSRARRLRELTESIRAFVGPALEAARDRRFEADRRTDRRTLAASREYCYLLHPAQSLQSLASPLLDWGSFARSQPASG